MGSSPPSSTIRFFPLCPSSGDQPWKIGVSENGFQHSSNNTPEGKIMMNNKMKFGAFLEFSDETRRLQICGWKLWLGHQNMAPCLKNGGIFTPVSAAAAEQVHVSIYPSLYLFICFSIDQSINQSTNQAINQIKSNQSSKQSINQSIKSTNQISLFV